MESSNVLSAANYAIEQPPIRCLSLSINTKMKAAAKQVAFCSKIVPRTPPRYCCVGQSSLQITWGRVSFLPISSLIEAPSANFIDKSAILVGHCCLGISYPWSPTQMEPFQLMHLLGTTPPDLGASQTLLQGLSPYNSIYYAFSKPCFCTATDELFYSVRKGQPNTCH